MQGCCPTAHSVSRSLSCSTDLSFLTAPLASDLFLPRCIFAHLLRGATRMRIQPASALAGARSVTAPPVLQTLLARRFALSKTGAPATGELKRESKLSPLLRSRVHARVINNH